MQKTIYLLFYFTFFISAQITISVEEDFNVFLNDSSIELSPSWLDSLKHEARHGKIHYQIAGYKTSKRSISTKLRLPQILTLNQVLRQTILYYSLLETEKEKEKEILFIYPFFSNDSEQEFIRCKYLKSTYYFYVNRWEVLPKPSQPTPEEKFIYNQILKNAMQNTMIFGELSEDIFKEVSILQNKPTSEIHRIYEKVVLWNASK